MSLFCIGISHRTAKVETRERYALQRSEEALRAESGCAEALILATEWKEFVNQDFEEVKKRMHTPLIFDGRNLFDPKMMRGFGFTYHAVGRPNGK